METVSFGVEWLSEDEFQMIYDDKDDEFDEEYIITIPNKHRGGVADGTKDVHQLYRLTE